MDYKAFYAEVADWIMQANTMALKYGLHSDEFWKWVMDSSAELCKKYENNKLVLNQMVMLYSWLEDFYLEAVSKK